MNCRLHRNAIPLLVAIICPVVLTTCVTAEEINPATSAFVAASDKMTTSLRTGQLASYRRNLRQDVFIADIADLAEQKSLGALENKKKKVPINWLCAPIYRYNVVATPLAATDARNQVLTSRTKAPSDDLGTLVLALGTSYAIPVEKGSTLEGSYDAWLAGKGKSCSDMVNNGDPYATRPLTTTEAFIAGALAAISLAETMWTVAKPVVVGALKNVDTERRANAIKAYFSDDNNVKIMKDQLATLENFLADEIKLEQTRAAGNAAALALTLYDASAPHWTNIRQAMSSTSCAVTAPDLGQRKTCIDSLLAAANKPLTDALDAADKFDTAMAKEIPVPKDRLSAQVETLQKIALGQQVTDDHLKAVWEASLRYISLFQSVRDAASADKQKKIVDAWTTFEKAINN